MCGGVASIIQQLEHGLGREIGLRQHRRAGLHQNVVLGELRRLLGDIDVADRGNRRLQVLALDLERRGGQLQARLRRAE